MPTSLTPATDGHLEIMRKDLAALQELRNQISDTGYTITPMHREVTDAGVDSHWTANKLAWAATSHGAVPRFLDDAIHALEDAIRHTAHLRDYANDAIRRRARA